MAKEKRTLAKTWEEFCKMTKRDSALPKEVIDKRAIADYKLSEMILHYNGGKLPDYTDYSINKYEPVWRIVKDDTTPSGFGLVFDDYDYWPTATIVGPRFAFLDVNVLKHMVKCFIAEYNDLLL